MKPKTEKKNAWVYVKFAIIIVVSGIFGAVCNMAIGAEFEDFTNLSAVLSQSLYGAGVPLLGGGLLLVQRLGRAQLLEPVSQRHRLDLLLIAKYLCQNDKHLCHHQYSNDKYLCQLVLTKIFVIFPAGGKRAEKIPPAKSRGDKAY